MKSRFDYVKYDDKAIEQQDLFKQQFMVLDSTVANILDDSDYTKEVIKHLEIAYMMVGKQVRDQQIFRNRTATLQEERKDG